MRVSIHNIRKLKDGRTSSFSAILHNNNGGKAFVVGMRVLPGGILVPPGYKVGAKFYPAIYFDTTEAKAIYDAAKVAGLGLAEEGFACMALCPDALTLSRFFSDAIPAATAEGGV